MLLKNDDAGAEQQPPAVFSCTTTGGQRLLTAWIVATAGITLCLQFKKSRAG
jgi:hypothetical protein